MGTFRFAVQTLFSDKKSTLFYGFTLFISIAITFVFFGIVGNETLLKLASEQFIELGGYANPADIAQMLKYIPTLLTFVIIFICIMCVFFANSFYIVGKSKYIAFMTLGGAGFFNIAYYVFFQNLLIAIVAVPLGLIGGYLGYAGICSLLFSVMNVTANPFALTFGLIFNTVFLVFMILIWIMLIDAGYTYRLKIVDLFNDERRMNTARIQSSSIKSWLYLMITILPLISLVIYDTNAVGYLMFLTLSIVGLSGVLKNTIPQFTIYLKKKCYQINPIKIISLNNYKASIKSCYFLIQIIISSTLFLVGFVVSFENNEYYFTLMIFAMAVVFILMAISIIYKQLIEAYSRVKAYNGLSKVGYTNKQLRKAVNQELFLFFTTIIGLILMILVPYLGILSSKSLFSLEWTLVIISMITGLLIITALVTRKMYMQIVLPVQLRNEVE